MRSAILRKLKSVSRIRIIVVVGLVLSLRLSRLVGGALWSGLISAAGLFDRRGLAKKLEEWTRDLEASVEKITLSWRLDDHLEKKIPFLHREESTRPFQDSPYPWTAVLSRRVYESCDLMKEIERLARVRAREFQRDVPFVMFENGGEIFDYSNFIEQHFPISESFPRGEAVHALLVGTPQEIPFAFQSLLDSVVSVGRLDFTDPPWKSQTRAKIEIERMRAYVDKVEAVAKSGPSKAAATLYSTGVIEPNVARQMSADLAKQGVGSGDTQMGRGLTAQFRNFLGHARQRIIRPEELPVRRTDEPLWDYTVRRYLVQPLRDRLDGWKPEITPSYLFGKSATTRNLLNRLADDSPCGTKYNVLFAASHGLSPADLATAGALTAYEGDSLDASFANPYWDKPLLENGIWFQFGCYSFGAPKNPSDVPWQRAKQTHRYDDFVAELPKALLGHKRGPLAFIGHLDATPYQALIETSEPDQAEDHEIVERRFGGRREAFLSAFHALMHGQATGVAVSAINKRADVLSSAIIQLFTYLQYDRPMDRAGSLAWLADSFVALSDARHWLVFGDPAVRLRSGCRA